MMINWPKGDKSISLYGTLACSSRAAELCTPRPESEPRRPLSCSLACAVTRRRSVCHRPPSCPPRAGSAIEWDCRARRTESPQSVRSLYNGAPQHISSPARVPGHGAHDIRGTIPTPVRDAIDGVSFRRREAHGGGEQRQHQHEDGDRRRVGHLVEWGLSALALPSTRWQGACRWVCVSGAEMASGYVATDRERSIRPPHARSSTGTSGCVCLTSSLSAHASGRGGGCMQNEVQGDGAATRALLSQLIARAPATPGAAFSTLAL